MLINGIGKNHSDIINHIFARADKSNYFEISPKIVPTAKSSKLTVRSKYAHLALAGKYFVLINPYYEYDANPFEQHRDQILEVTAQNNEIQFEYDFKSEQMYRIMVAELLDTGYSLILTTFVYALDGDLFSLLPLIGDFHSHTIYSDGLEDPKLVLESAIRQKLDFIAITDHNSYKGSVIGQICAKENNYPITVINGEEYSSTFTNMHIISLGAKQPLPEALYRFEAPETGHPLTAYQYICQLADHIRENGGISVMCHPLWKPFGSDGSRGDVPHSLVKELMENKIFDAIEIVGGSPITDSMTSQMHYCWAVTYGATPDNTAYLGSTDAHRYSVDPISGKHFTVVFAKDHSQEAILDAVKNKMTVAVQIIDDNNALCYGLPRYCMFAQFYVKEILNKVQ